MYRGILGIDDKLRYGPGDSLLTPGASIGVLTMRRYHTPDRHQFLRQLVPGRWAYRYEASGQRQLPLD